MRQPRCPCVNPVPMAWLRQKSTHLREVAKLLDTACGGLAAVLARCDRETGRTS
jgi:hypothetical protein